MKAVVPFHICFILNEHCHKPPYSSPHHRDLNSFHVLSCLYVSRYSCQEHVGHIVEATHSVHLNNFFLVVSIM